MLEAGFDKVTPSHRLIIGSWGLERALAILGDKIIDSTAVDIDCYHPGYTFVEKLQTIATKFWQKQSEQKERPNYMRQYYDVACLLVPIAQNSATANLYYKGQRPFEEVLGTIHANCLTSRGRGWLEKGTGFSRANEYSCQSNLKITNFVLNF